MSLSDLEFLEAETARDQQIDAAFLSGSSLDSVFQSFLEGDLKNWAGDESTGKDAQPSDGGPRRPEVSNGQEAFGSVSPGGPEDAANE